MLCTEQQALALFDGTTIYSLAPLPNNTAVTNKIRTVECVRVGTTQGDALQFLNVAVRKAMESHDGITRMFESYYDMRNPLRLDDRRTADAIDIYPGWFTEIALRVVNGTPRYCLTIDPSHKVMAKESVLYSVLYQSKDPNRARNTIIGRRVTTVYNYKSYVVEDIDYNKTPLSTFKRVNRRTGEEETITFEQYYKEVGHPIKDTRQPLLLVTGRQREQIFLVPEFCVPAAVPAMAKQKLPQLTSVKPTERVARIESLRRLISDAGDQRSHNLLKAYGLILGDKTIPVQHHAVLPSPPLMFAPGKEVNLQGQSEWRREASNINYSHIRDKKSIHALIVYDSAEVGTFAMEYWNLIKNKLHALNAPLTFAQDLVFGFDARQFHGDFERTLSEATSRFPLHLDKKNCLVVAFLASDKRRSTADYDAYRQFCLHNGYVGQGVDASPDSQRRKMDRKNQDSIVTNIARQIVNKYGYQSWWMTIQKTAPRHANKQFMFVGIDVFHAAPKLVRGEKQAVWQKRSIAGFTAKLVHNGMTSVFCSSEIRDAGAELAGQRTQSAVPQEGTENPGSSFVRDKVFNPDQEPLSTFINNALTHWQAVIRADQLVLIVYRDGVADSQMDELDAAEVDQIKHILHPSTHFIYSVVQKRVNNRFVMRDGEKYGNCPSGTLVEDLARLGQRYNFFLVPCATNLSTNKPVHYTICHDSHPNALSPQEFHALTYASHHCYQNWAGTVKVPDVCQYAHKLAYTLGEAGVTNPVVPDLLKDSMFYL